MKGPDETFPHTTTANACQDGLWPGMGTGKLDKHGQEPKSRGPGFKGAPLVEVSPQEETEVRKPFSEFGKDKLAPVVKSEDELLEQERFEKLVSEYKKAIVASTSLSEIAIEPRRKLVGEWMREGDLGFIYGYRGSGKTWLVDFLAAGISNGYAPRDDTWEFCRPENVLLVDGEMPFDDFKSRLSAFGTNEKLHIMHHEVLFNQSGRHLNLAEPTTQRVVTELCDTVEIKVLILDNLSCLFSGMKENDNDAWEAVLNWLLELRRKRIAVIIVHHAGRNGQMRGASRREDAAFWVIKVEEIKKLSRDEVGARFQTDFEKQRNNAAPEWSKEWSMIMCGGELTIGCTELSFDEKVLRLIQDGLHNNRLLAEELHCSPGTISKSAQRLEGQKLIDIVGKTRNARYLPKGFMNKEQA